MTDRVARRCGVLVLFVAGIILPVQAQQPSAPAQRATGTLNEAVRAVLVDVVVRDKRGLPVKDLTQADFEVLEDNVPQAIGSFTTFFEGTPASGAPTATPAADPTANHPAAAIGTAPAAAQTPTVTALVFDRLSPEARRLAVLAATSYLGNKEDIPGYFGVFSIDNALTPYAPFTRNVRQLRQALAKMESRSSASFNSPEQREQKANADQVAASAGAGAAAAAQGGGPGTSANMGSAGATAQLAEMQSNMIRDFEIMEHDQQGYATTNGLFAIVNQMRRLPGRKSLVLFSEGILIPPAVQRLFLGVIDAANRANVSIYAMDAAGLRAESEQKKIADQVNQAAQTGINTAYASSSGNASRPLTQGLENNEEVLRQDPHSSLGELSQDTGGVLFENTNNLRQGFDRIENDLRNYYLLGYTPANDKYDGRFRTIDVRVKRSGVTVAARKGYFAVRDAGGLPINAWEAPALGALEQKPVPNAFPVRAAALLFPERDRPGLTPVVVDLATAPLTFQRTEDGSNYTSDFAVLVRFIDDRKQVVRKVSQHYEVKGPIGEMDRAKRGEVIFYREPELPSGVYTMETVVHDAPSGKSSVRLSTVEVARDGPGLRMSSLILVKRGEKVPEKDRRADNPLLVKDAVLYPNLGEPVSKASKEVGFYFACYPVDGQPAPISAIELLDDNGKTIAQLPMELAPAAPGTKRIQQVGRLPLDQIAPGTYELRAIVKQGSEQVYRSATLRITE